ncbi:MAG: DNA polymerase Y family protein [Actinomycetota bacterium]
MAAVRMLVVRCDDWPIIAAGVPLDVPAAVFHANRVVAASPAARAEDVLLQQRRREAQSRCPSLRVLDHDPARDARAFESIVASLDALTPRVEITEPGQVAFPTRGPSRFFGGDDALALRTLAVVSEAVSAQGASREAASCHVGVADGPFAAALAARAARGAPVVVPPGGAPAFLAPLPISTLERPDLVDVLSRLGLHTLGALAALPGPDVLARFGAEGLLAWRLASGLDERPPATAPPPADLTVSTELDPPADTVAPAAFLARGLAEELHSRLWAKGSACTRVVIGAETEHGERHERVWRAEGALTAAAIADRLRWQLDGWLQGSARHRPTAGISRLWLAPDEVVPAGGRQLGFWGSDAATADRASRAVARVQGLLGTGSVAVPEWRGSRDPATQIALVAAEAVDLTVERPGAHRDRVVGPWPGRLPTPAPARVHSAPLSAEVVDSDGHALEVSGRGALSAAPARLSVSGAPWTEVVSWAGPWPLEERWWDSARGRRRARLQLVTADGQARLVVLEQGRWHVTATYD